LLSVHSTAHKHTLHKMTAMLKLSVLLLGLLGYGQASAEMRGSWNGFVSQGWILSDHNNFYGDSDGTRGSFDYRELGLNGFIQATPQLKFNAQILSRLAGATSDGDPDLDYLFADWSLLQQTDQQAGLRLGRIKNAYGFFNETRDIAFTRPGIIMPQSIYFDQVRELLLSSDGIALYYRKNTDQGQWLVDAQYGQLQTGSSTEAILMGRTWAGSFGDSTVKLARVIFEPNGERWRFGFTGLDSSLPFSPAPADLAFIPTAGKVTVQMAIVSAQYNQEYWSFTTEALQGKTRWHNLGPIFADAKTMRSFYLQLDHRLSHQWQLMLRYDQQQLDKDDPQGKAFSQRPGAGPGHQQYSRDWALGLRYQPDSQWDLGAELHQTEGTSWLFKQDNPDPTKLKKHWQMLILQAAYRF
jgi:hypothetical protein